jgi:hypothetical protein
MAAAGEEKEVKVLDARVAWLRSRICSSLKCKDDKLDRLFGNEDSAACVASFLDTGDCNRLLIFDAGKGELAAVRAPAGRHTPPAFRAASTLSHALARAAPTLAPGTHARARAMQRRRARGRRPHRQPQPGLAECARFARVCALLP